MAAQDGEKSTGNRMFSIIRVHSSEEFLVAILRHQGPARLVERLHLFLVMP
jgi:hypothetical protein